jgi:hypothetical protein
MLRKIQAWATFTLFLAVVAGGLYLWWRFDLRWRPHVITKNQADIAQILDQAGWVSPSHGGAKLYVIVYGDCVACKRLQAQFGDLAQAGVDTRVIAVARPDLNGQAQSTAAERSTVAELWVNRSWPLFQRWSAAAPGTWTAPGVPLADGDVARTAVVEAGRSMVEKLRPLLQANGVRFDYPTLIWWTKDGKMEGCACRAQASWARMRGDIGAK